MAYLSTKHNFFFIHIYKNAGTSVKNALAKLEPNGLKPKSLKWRVRRKVERTLGGVFVPRKRGMDRLIQLNTLKFGHLVFQDIEDNINVDQLKFFAICRNPWDWQVSLYRFVRGFEDHFQHNMTTEMSFDEYIHWRCHQDARLQKNFLVDFRLRVRDIFVLRFENLHEDWGRLSTHLGVELPPLPHTNRSNAKNEAYKDYYTPETRALVEETFAEDIEYFNYSFDG
ncbi:MAG: sulfotransferase family 2 domain-containing protein [Planctomycetota bacterium]